jgi:hypothetical protein
VGKSLTDLPSRSIDNSSLKVTVGRTTRLSASAGSTSQRFAHMGICRRITAGVLA